MNTIDLRSKALISFVESICARSLNASELEQVTDIARWSKVVPKQCYQWVGDTMRLADLLSEGTSSPDAYGMFWIRLHIVITEVHGYLQKFAELKSGADAGNFARVESVKALFSGDETAFIDYQRQCQCHMSPGLLRVKRQKGVKIETKYKDQSIYDLDTVFHSIMETYAKKHQIEMHEADRIVAQDFAARSRAALRTLYEYMYDWVK